MLLRHYARHYNLGKEKMFLITPGIKHYSKTNIGSVVRSFEKQQNVERVQLHNSNYRKLDHCEMKFQSFYWLSHHGIISQYNMLYRHGKRMRDS